MSVGLIGVTKSVIEECNTAGELLAFIARVSNPTNQDNHRTSGRLLRYLVKNKHWSPFEMVSLTIEIKTSRDIGRQILRHRSFSFQEFSQRYAAVDMIADLQLREARMQDLTNRQSSIETDDPGIVDEWNILQRCVWDNAVECYGRALTMGIAKEQARALLPEGLTPTHLYMAGTLRSWMHYIALRCGNGTQKEHREIAMGCANILMQEFPELTHTIETLITEAH